MGTALPALVPGPREAGGRWLGVAGKARGPQGQWHAPPPLSTGMGGRAMLEVLVRGQQRPAGPCSEQHSGPEADAADLLPSSAARQRGGREPPAAEDQAHFAGSWVGGVGQADGAPWPLQEPSGREGLALSTGAGTRGAVKFRLSPGEHEASRRVGPTAGLSS